MHKVGAPPQVGGDSNLVHGHCSSQFGNPERALCGEGDLLEAGRIGITGGDKMGTKPARLSGQIIQLVGEDKKFGWRCSPS